MYLSNLVHTSTKYTTKPVHKCYTHEQLWRCNNLWWIGTSFCHMTVTSTTTRKAPTKLTTFNNIKWIQYYKCNCMRNKRIPFSQSSKFSLIRNWTALTTDQGHGLGNFPWILLISTIISYVSSTLNALRTSWSCHNFVAPKTALATRGCLKTKAAKRMINYLSK